MPTSKTLTLPSIVSTTEPVLRSLTDTLGVPREALASQEEIEHAWTQLPKLLNSIPPALRTEQLLRMCVAVSAGLLDAAVNYAWNSAIVELRRKIRDFGLHIVPQITGKPIDEKGLVELKDAQLLQLCLSLNLLDEDAFFFLDQCRSVRNNFSSAHPPIGTLDDHEFLAFFSRCAKYALCTATNPQGVDPEAFVKAVKGDRFTEAQADKWLERLSATHDAQRELLIGTLHGIYCDPNSQEEARQNALALCKRLAPSFTPKAKSELLNRHSEYVAKGKIGRQTASQEFFSKLEILNLLSEVERHSIISRASRRLLAVHDDFDNFYNEPPFAERLLELSEQGAIPPTAQLEFVRVVLLCATGSQYGVSRGAMSFYQKIIKNFSPKEIALMLDAPASFDRLSYRIKNFPSCRQRFGALVGLLDAASVPTTAKRAYQKWMGAT